MLSKNLKYGNINANASFPEEERDPNIANHYASYFIILHFHSSIRQEIHKPDSTKMRRIEHKRKVIRLLMPYIVLIKSEYFFFLFNWNLDLISNFAANIGFRNGIITRRN